MSEENNQLVAGGIDLSKPVQIKPEVLQMRDEALAASALIGRVETGPQNEQSAKARKIIRGILSLFETGRKRLKEPVLEKGREIDRVVDSARLELQKEDARLENLEKDFMRAELRRRAEEEELQRKELARIEAERQAEMLRIAREQAEAERKAREVAEAAARAAREQAEAAARLAAEATNKKQREAAEAARIEAERVAEAARVEAVRVAEEAAERARQQTQLATERADQAAMLESKPVEISRAKGQSVRKKWRIERIDSFVLAKARPDLVRKIEFDMLSINQLLMEGVSLPGVIAVEDISVTSRASKNNLTVDI